MKNRIKAKYFRDQIYDIIVNLIVSRQLLPGEKIIEETLSKEIGVSRTPVREALNRLEKDGIVKTVPRRGAFVRKHSKESVLEILRIREVLEGLIVRILTHDMDEQTLNRLKKSVEKIGSISDTEENLLKFTQADRDFHNILHEAYKSRSKILKNMMNSVEAHLLIIRLRTVVIPGRAKKTVAEHKEILMAMEARDANLAEELMRKHIKSVRESALEHFEELF